MKWKMNGLAMLNGETTVGAQYDAIQFDLPSQEVRLLYKNTLVATLPVFNMSVKDTLTVTGLTGYCNFTMLQDERS